MPEFVQLETGGEIPEGVAVIRLDRPPMNALCDALAGELIAAAEECSRNNAIRSVVIYGGPKLFAAGADVKEFATMGFSEISLAGLRLARAGAAVAAIPKPTVAAVTGYALGGGLELAMCADVRIAGDNARLGQPEVLLGLIPGAGGTQRLTRLVGPSKAKDICFTGRQVRAEEALAIGLVDKVVAPDDVLAEAIAWAAQFSKGPQLILKFIKEAIDRGQDVDLETGLGIEAALFYSCFATEDAKIGTKSFVENGPGKAEFVGR